jgi:hypothetical protein
MQKSASQETNRFVTEVRELRDRTLRALVREEHIFSVPEHHRDAVTLLFVWLYTAPATEAQVAQQFYECYRHLAEGGSVDTLPLKIVPKTDVVHAIRRSLRGDKPYISRMEKDDHNERREDRDPDHREACQEGGDAEEGRQVRRRIE